MLHNLINLLIKTKYTNLICNYEHIPGSLEKYLYDKETCVTSTETHIAESIPLLHYNYCNIFPFLHQIVSSLRKQDQYRLIILSPILPSIVSPI